jgi:hypothetical protein
MVFPEVAANNPCSDKIIYEFPVRENIGSLYCEGV